MRRVVITGIGCVTPVGIQAQGLRKGLKARRSAVRPVTRFDPSAFASQIAAEVDDFHPEDFLRKKLAKRLDRFSQFGVVSALLALEDAELRVQSLDPDRTGVMMGSALGGVAYAEDQAGSYMRDGIKAVRPNLALSVFGGAVSCNIAIELGLTGPNATNAMSCAAGTVAVGSAAETIRSRRADVMFAGGAEAPLSPLCFGAFSIIRAMSTRNDEPSSASRPFDRERDGFVMAEGAAVLVLEERERAVARGARIYAEVVGYGLTSDGHHMTAPKPDGRESARAMQIALQEAGVAPGEVGYINAHGSSTPLNDPIETIAVKRVFGEHAYRLAVSGTKGYYGHALGASGAIEAAICALGLAEGWFPPTLNLIKPDPACDLNYLADGGLNVVPEFVLSNSFGFGGVNASLVFKRP